jgi:signal peptidase II
MRWLVVVGLLTLCADQVTKYLAVAHLTTALDGREGFDRVTHFVRAKNLDNDPVVPGQPYKLHKPVHVLEQYWHFRYVENPGAAWGMFSNLPEAVRRPFFHVISLTAIGFILYMFRRLPKDANLVRLALSLVLGGALGNFADRLARGYVIDFIDWHWRNQPSMRWPTFNVADAAICVGVALLLVDSLKKKPAPVPPDAPQEPSASAMSGPGPAVESAGNAGPTSV